MSLSHKAHSPNAPGDEAVGKSSPKSATPELKRRILVPIADGSEEIETSCITDTLSRFGAEVLVASCMPQVGDKVKLVCTMSRGLKIMADITIDEAAADEYDAIILPGGVMGARNLRQCEPLISLLQRQKKARKLYGGICAAPAIVLAPAGLLGPGATCYPAKTLRDEMKDPADEAVVVQEAGTLITSQGPGTSFRFALQVGEELFGKAEADSVARKLLVDRDAPLYGNNMMQEFPPKNCHEIAPQMGYGEVNDSSDGSGRGKRKRSSQEESVLKTSRKDDMAPKAATGTCASLFDRLIWPELEKMGWHIEIGNRPGDKYFCKPNTHRGAPYKNRLDFFDSVKQVFECLKYDEEWSNKDEVKECLEKYHACQTAKSAHEESVPKTSRKNDDAPNAATGTSISLFNHLVWPELEKMGWHIEIGNRPGDKYFCKPNAHRKAPYKKRLHFFNSVKQVFECLNFDEEWSSKDEVKGCLEKYRACQAAKNQCKALGTLPKDWSPEWLLNEAKQLQESMTK